MPRNALVQFDLIVESMPMTELRHTTLLEHHACARRLVPTQVYRAAGRTVNFLHYAKVRRVQRFCQGEHRSGCCPFFCQTVRCFYRAASGRRIIVQQQQEAAASAVGIGQFLGPRNHTPGRLRGMNCVLWSLYRLFGTPLSSSCSPCFARRPQASRCRRCGQSRRRALREFPQSECWTSLMRVWTPSGSRGLTNLTLASKASMCAHAKSPCMS